MKYRDFYVHLFESPIDLGDSHDGISKNFSDENFNRNYVKKLSHTKEFDSYTDYKIFKFKAPDSELVDIFIKDGLCCLIVKHVIKEESIVSSDIWQHISQKGLFRECIFKYYLVKYSSWITGNVMSKKGKSALEKTIKYAVDNGYEVFTLKHFSRINKISSENEIHSYFTKFGEGYDYRFEILKK